MQILYTLNRNCVIIKKTSNYWGDKMNILNATIKVETGETISIKKNHQNKTNFAYARYNDGPLHISLIELPNKIIYLKIMNNSQLLIGGTKIQKFDLNLCSKSAIVIESYGDHTKINPDYNNNLYNLKDEYLHVFVGKNISFEFCRNLEENETILAIIIPDHFLEALLGENLYANSSTLSASPKIKFLPKTITKNCLRDLNLETSQDYIQTNSFDIQLNILDVLISIYKYFNDTTNEDEKNNNNRFISRNMTNKIRQNLISIKGPLPDLLGICEIYGVSIRKLNNSFKTYYGSSIYTVVTKERFMLAHNKIRFTNTSLKEISYALGYSHVNHFNSAFKKHFGYPPGSLRKTSTNRNFNENYIAHNSHS